MMNEIMSNEIMKCESDEMINDNNEMIMIMM